MLSAEKYLSRCSLIGPYISVALRDLKSASSLGGRLQELRGHSVLVATRAQLTAAFALTELDGIARLACSVPGDLSREFLPGVGSAAGADAIVSDEASSEVNDDLSSVYTEVRAPHPLEGAKPQSKIWLMALVVGLLFAWPALFAVLRYGPEIILRLPAGDSYHYLAIARKAQLAHIYTYDGAHVTNGFHPLWEYAIRGMFSVLNLQTHEAQAIAVMLAALIASTAGIMLAAVAVIRLTNRYFLALLLVPGLFYLTIGIHVRTLWVWAALNGMESAFSLLFGGLFFYVLSLYTGSSARKPYDPVSACRALGLVLPFIILSRLDDVFILPALLLALVLFETSVTKRVIAGIWISGPSILAILCYLVYNKVSVGAVMPLSGSTKSGFVGFLSVYLTAAVHFAPILDLKTLLTKKAADPTTVFSNSFRVVELVYPMLAAGFGAWAIWKYWRRQPELAIMFAICLYIIFKMGYNFLNVHPWNQAGWYYTFIALCLSVMGAVALQESWKTLDRIPVGRYGIVTFYVMLLMLSASQFYASFAYQSPDSLVDQFWKRHDEIRSQLVAHDVRGIINVDDGITAFLLDFPNMHGFAFATDVQAQQAYRSGNMLSLAYSRGINTIAGFEYMSADHPPQSDTDIREYLRDNPLSAETMRSEMDQFELSLAYYDPVLKMPFISFKPKSSLALTSRSVGQKASNH